MQDQPGLESDPSYSEAAEQSQPAAAETNVIVLVHGIRDFGLWESTIRDTLEKEGFKVEPTNYGRLNLIEFLLPMWFFRRRAIEEVKKQIEIVVMNNSGKPISIIAHSFGTFVIAHLMKDAFALRFRRVVFCGSVVPYGFGFEQFQDRYSAPILNEVGTRDVWPAVAESVTTGYGSAGPTAFSARLCGTGGTMVLATDTFWTLHSVGNSGSHSSGMARLFRLRKNQSALALGFSSCRFSK